jgi:hypothetical protein
VVGRGLEGAKGKIGVEGIEKDGRDKWKVIAATVGREVTGLPAE